jgi:hypothetical protein
VRVAVDGPELVIGAREPGEGRRVQCETASGMAVEPAGGPDPRRRSGAPVTTTNKELARRAAELVKGSDGLQRKAANIVRVALGTTGTIASAGNALADLWQADLRDAALDIIGRLARSSRPMLMMSRPRSG